MALVAVVVERTLAPLLVVVVAVAAAVQVCNAAVYKVGDSAGWTTIGNVDYKQWAATKSFGLGDIILFEYNSKFHNVMRVTHAEYRACNATVPIATFTTGNDSITISAHGHHYFLCGVPGHCQSGQKVDINVPRITTSMAPTPSALVSPTTPINASTPGPSTSKAAPLNAVMKLVGLAMAMFAVFVSGFA